MASIQRVGVIYGCHVSGPVKDYRAGAGRAGWTALRNLLERDRIFAARHCKHTRRLELGVDRG